MLDFLRKRIYRKVAISALEKARAWLKGESSMDEQLKLRIRTAAIMIAVPIIIESLTPAATAVKAWLANDATPTVVEGLVTFGKAFALAIIAGVLYRIDPRKKSQ